ncbi:MAG: AmmeMemoRadiSam system protein B [Nanoarchaeota archaeon]
MKKSFFRSMAPIILVMLLFGCAAPPIEKNVREPAVAGSWYPGDNATLHASLQERFAQIPRFELNGTVRALIVPHAGYAFSGGVAAAGFKQLSHYETVFVLGPSHHLPLRGIMVPNYTHFRTPLGEVPVSGKTAPLAGRLGALFAPETKEHSIELELPFLQERIGSFYLVPLLVGQTDAAALKDALSAHLGKDDLVVVSADLSHYHPWDQANALDSSAMGMMKDLDAQGILSAEIDAPWAVSALLLLAKEKGWKPVLVSYANSGDITSDRSSVVGYAAVAFVEPEAELTADDKEELLALARQSIVEYTMTGKKPNVDAKDLSPALTEEQGCFVTIEKNSALRGCVGHIFPQEALYQCVIDNAANAAAHDSRFLPLTPAELEAVIVEVSILSVPQPLLFSSGDDLKEKLTPLRDGVVLRKGRLVSVYLPQVWEELPDKDIFLSSLCEKGGMPKLCWQDTATQVFVYQADVFEEAEN